MKLKLLSKKVLTGIPSASGIELYNNKLYIIGDDSAWLFILDTQLNLVEKIPLLTKRKRIEGRIPKKIKLDLEAMTFATINGEDILLIFGSGSKPKKREKLFAVYPARKHKVVELSLEDFYHQLFGKDNNDAVLNIEAAAANDKELFIFHRGNISGRHVMFNFQLDDFLDIVIKKEKTKVEFGFINCTLPSCKNIPSGFSGAAMLDGERLVFSASVEDTENEIDDGNVLGSFIGILNAKTGELECELLKEGTRTLLVKVESVCLKQSKGTVHTLYAVTDSDGGESELLEIEMTL